RWPPAHAPLPPSVLSLRGTLPAPELAVRPLPPPTLPGPPALDSPLAPALLPPSVLSLRGTAPQPAGAAGRSPAAQVVLMTVLAVGPSPAALGGLPPPLQVAVRPPLVQVAVRPPPVQVAARPPPVQGARPPPVQGARPPPVQVALAGPGLRHVLERPLPSALSQQARRPPRERQVRRARPEPHLLRARELLLRVPPSRQPMSRQLPLR